MPYSALWNYFTKCGNNEAKCCICSKTLKSGNTNNLNYHLRSQHPENVQEIMGNKSETPSMSSHSPSPLPALEISDSDMSMPMFRSRSPLRTPKASQTPSMRQMTLFECLGRQDVHETVRPSETGVTKALVSMIIRGNHPYSFVEGESFMHFTNALAPWYKIPSRETMDEIIRGAYTTAVEAVKITLANAQYISLTVELCTLNNLIEKILVTTAHFIDHQEIKLESVLFGIRILKEDDTAEYVAAEMEDLLLNFNIPKEKIVGVCTDGTENMVAMVEKLLGDGKNVDCFALFLNSIVSEGIDDDNNERLKCFISEINCLVSFLRDNREFVDKLIAMHEWEGTDEDDETLFVQLALPQCYTSHPWTTVYKVLKRFLELIPMITPIMATCSIENAPCMISDADLELLREILDILKLFDQAAKEISCNDYIMGSLVIPLVINLEKTLENRRLEHEASRMLSQKLLSSLADKKPKLLLNPLLCLAKLSDPRFKNRYMNSSFGNQTVNTFNQELDKCLPGSGKISPSLQTEETDTDYTNEFWFPHHQLVSRNELTRYLEQPLEQRSCNPIGFWEERRSCMSTLSKVALKYLCLVGSSLPSEKLTDILNVQVSNEDNDMIEQRIVERVFLNRLQDKYWSLG